MARSSRTTTGFVKLPDGGFAPAAEFPSGRVVTDDDDLVGIGYDRRLHESPDNDVRTGVLDRHQDESGVSGTGVVADFAVFPSGRVVMEWRNEENESLDFTDTGLDIRPSMKAAVGIHGHHGKTKFVYDDGEVAEA